MVFEKLSDVSGEAEIVLCPLGIWKGGCPEHPLDNLDHAFG